MTGITVILASASPRRRELMTLVGIAHRVVVTDTDEAVRPGEAPAVYADRVARAKAAAVDTSDRNTVVIAADTIVVIDDVILGKPVSEDDAARMLATLSGRTHTVYTAVAVRRGSTMVSSVEHVAVTFRTLSDDDIRSYVRTGEPMDKAGAYGIQGFGATIVERIDGDYFSVMGLSLVRMVRLLADVGIRYEFGTLHFAE
jgi:septum formation protein